MNGCIDVGAAMFGHLQAIRSVVVPARHLARLLDHELKILFSRPENRVYPEGISEIDKPRPRPGMTITLRRATRQQAHRTSQPSPY